MAGRAIRCALEQLCGEDVNEVIFGLTHAGM